MSIIDLDNIAFSKNAHDKDHLNFSANDAYKISGSASFGFKEADVKNFNLCLSSVMTAIKTACAVGKCNCVYIIPKFVVDGTSTNREKLTRQLIKHLSKLGYHIILRDDFVISIDWDMELKEKEEKLNRKKRKTKRKGNGNNDLDTEREKESDHMHPKKDVFYDYWYGDESNGNRNQTMKDPRNGLDMLLQEKDRYPIFTRKARERFQMKPVPPIIPIAESEAVAVASSSHPPRSQTKKNKKKPLVIQVMKRKNT